MAQDFLHNLQHIDHSFNPVSNEIIMPSSVDELWRFNTNKYQESIQMFFIIPIIFCIIYSQILLIIIISYCCFGKFKNKFEYGKHKNLLNNKYFHELSLLYEKKLKNKKYIIKLTLYSKIIRYIFTFLIIIILIISIIYSQSFNKSIINISNKWSNSYNQYETIIINANQINNTYITDAI